jgi:DNA repair exonuclease SbcCD nuclease subunit
MKTIHVISDLHIGVQRSGGTTTESAAALRKFTLDRLTALLAPAKHVAINGDFFDTYQVPMTDLFQAYLTLSEWLHGGGEDLWLIPGNHDLSKNSANMSSFELLAQLLLQAFPDKVRYLAGGNWVDTEAGIYAISHVPNQDLFELELGRVPDDVKTLLLHCNFDNEFAGQSDHSLNIARAQAKELTQRGITLVLGHEHQSRTMMNDKVILVGNQFPTSVSDCMAHGEGQKDGRKYFLEITGDDMELKQTWSKNDDVGGYAEVDWEDLANAPKGRKFIRVSGNATAAEAPGVIKAISKFRQTSEAFVVTNAVRIAGRGDSDELAESVEDIRTINVIDMLLETLDADQQAVVRKLLLEDTNG